MEGMMLEGNGRELTTDAIEEFIEGVKGSMARAREGYLLIAWL